MRTALGLLLIILMAHPALCAQFGSDHKSEEQIARMTPDQRVKEYCREHTQHLFPSHREYVALLTKHLRQDGIKVTPQVIREIEAYDPTRRESAGEQKFRRYEGANFILDVLDVKVFRVRAFEEGRKAIEAIRRSIEQMRVARFDKAKDEKYGMNLRYQLSLSYLEHLEGLSRTDEGIQDTLKHEYGITLSDGELSDFVNYLISQDPYYPGWSEREMRKEDPRNASSKWLFLYKNPEQFHQAYMEYKANSAKPK
jgi:hypothetical protein